MHIVFFSLFYNSFPIINYMLKKNHNILLRVSEYIES